MQWTIDHEHNADNGMKFFIDTVDVVEFVLDLFVIGLSILFP